MPLTDEERIETTDVSNAALTNEQYRQLSPQIKQFLSDNPGFARQFIQEFGGIRDEQPLTFYQLRDLGWVARLIKEAIPIEDLLALDPTVRAELLKYSMTVYLLTHGAIPFKELVALDPTVRTELLKHSRNVHESINDAKIPFAELTTLSLSVCVELLRESYRVVRLIREGHILFSGIYSPYFECFRGKVRFECRLR